MRKNIYQFFRDGKRKYINQIELFASNFHEADIAFFHKFEPSPSGGGHQFLRALWKQMEKHNLRLENNTISPTTQACLFNSFNFESSRLRLFNRPNCRMVHRVDGPISAYRGKDEKVDRRIWEINQEFANETIFQSNYSYRKHLEMGLEFINPHIIMNAVDPQIFYPTHHYPFDRDRKIRLISVSWSDNPNKGSTIYRWLDDNLDWDKYEYTFVGRTNEIFKHIKLIPPLTSVSLATLLRKHHIYITASQNDPCSNSLIEALACGLPAIYLHSGGHPEIVQSAGYGFNEALEIPDLIKRIIEEYEMLEGLIELPGISKITDQYLEVMGVKGEKPFILE